ncbi:MAG: bstEII [Desulfobulbaceae bacterium]|nr:bstEII [Desulfobulbaceae bacterium]
MTPAERRFADYKDEGQAWITLANGEHYPDILPDACRLYEPVLVEFRRLLRASHSSTDLFGSIMESTNQWMRTQLCRVFKKYVSPQTPVEMLKRKTDAAKICAQFGYAFRGIVEVQHKFETRPMPDEALCAVLWEYKDRGRKGYDMTERLFEILRSQHAGLVVHGPERAGKDVLMGRVFLNYPKPDRPVDFLIADTNSNVLAIGLARYDSDRGGAQEDDRIGQYREVAQEILGYADSHGMPHIKVVFVNDGPGLLLGSMWNDYAYIEALWPGRVKVVTLRMVPDRITAEWLRS